MSQSRLCADCPKTARTNESIEPPLYNFRLDYGLQLKLQLQLYDENVTNNPVVTDAALHTAA